MHMSEGELPAGIEQQGTEKHIYGFNRLVDELRHGMSLSLRAEQALLHQSAPLEQWVSAVEYTPEQDLEASFPASPDASSSTSHLLVHTRDLAKTASLSDKSPARVKILALAMTEAKLQLLRERSEQDYPQVMMAGGVGERAIKGVHKAAERILRGENVRLNDPEAAIPSFSPFRSAFEKRTRALAVGSVMGLALSACSSVAHVDVTREVTEQVVSFAVNVRNEKQLSTQEVMAVKDAMLGQQPDAASYDTNAKQEAFFNLVKVYSVTTYEIGSSTNSLSEYFATYPGYDKNGNQVMRTSWVVKDAAGWEVLDLEPDPDNKPLDTHIQRFGLMLPDGTFKPVMQLTYNEKNQLQEERYWSPTVWVFPDGLQGQKVLEEGMVLPPGQDFLVNILGGMGSEVAEQIPPTTMGPTATLDQGQRPAIDYPPEASVDDLSPTDLHKLSVALDAWTAGWTDQEKEWLTALTNRMLTKAMTDQDIATKLEKFATDKLVLAKDNNGDVIVTTVDGKQVWPELKPTVEMPENGVFGEFVNDIYSFVIEDNSSDQFTVNSKGVLQTPQGKLIAANLFRELGDKEEFGKFLQMENVAFDPTKTIAISLEDSADNGLSENFQGFADFNKYISTYDGWTRIGARWVKFELSEEGALKIRIARETGGGYVITGSTNGAKNNLDQDTMYYILAAIKVAGYVKKNGGTYPQDMADKLSLKKLTVSYNGTSFSIGTLVGTMPSDLHVVPSN